MGLVAISREQAIKVMENNLKFLKECADTDKFLLLSYDLEQNKSLGRARMNALNGAKLINKSKTFVLNEEESEEDAVSTLSIYTKKQSNIYNILPIGIKHDMLLVHKLE